MSDELPVLRELSDEEHKALDLTKYSDRVRHMDSMLAGARKSMLAQADRGTFVREIAWKNATPNDPPPRRIEYDGKVNYWWWHPSDKELAVLNANTHL